MKKTTIKQLLFIFALLLGGASSAWADPTVIYHRALTTDGGATVWSASDIGTGKWVTTSGTPTVSVMESETVIGLKSASQGEVSNSTQITLTANKMLIVDAVWVYGGSEYVTDAHFNIGSNIKIMANPKGPSGSVIFNGTDSRSISNACSKSAGTRASDTWTIHAVINTVTNKVTALTVRGAHASTPATFTLSEEVSLTGTPTYNAFTTGQTGHNDGYVILKSLKVSEDTPYAYSVKWKSGETEMGTFTSGYDLSGTEKTFPYYRYLCKDNVLYKISTGNSTEVPTCSFTLSTNPQTVYMTGYSAQSGYCVYCEEAENIVGMTRNTSTSANNRASGRATGYCSEDITITSLPAGTYTAKIGLLGNGTAQTFTLKADKDYTKSDFSSSTRDEWSETFTITETTNIKINGGNSSNAIDNIYIMCASAKVAACDNLGYTFSSPYALDFTGSSIKAYIAKYTSGDVVTLSQVNKVPANTGLFIKSSSSLSNVSIPTTTAATDKVTDNVLVAQSTTGKVAQSTDTKTNYVLGLVSGTPTFLKVPTAGQEVAAGKAYLSINYSSGLSRMNIVFEDEATGISDATHLNENGKMTNDNYYDLSGRRVAQPTKGLYIVNGKKVVIK